MENKLIFEEEIISLIQEKSELKSLNVVYVKKIFLSLLSSSDIDKLNSYSSFKQCKRSKVCNSLVSSSRKILRERYGVFIKKPISNFKNKLNSISSFDDPFIETILDSHQSTFERHSYYSSFYPLLFEKLFSLGLKKDFSLGDFACGYNPFAYSFFPFKPNYYFACDLSDKEMSIVDYFFKSTNISGSALGYDLLSNSFSDFLSTNAFDVVFLLKALDSLESVKKHSSKKLLSKIKTKFFVISFPLVSIGGKNTIDSSRRSWFETFCKKEGWSFSSLSVPNELFYVVKKE